MTKILSKKLPRPVPPEFEPMLLQYGWDKVNNVFGKNPAEKFYAALGAERLKAARARFVRGEV